MVQRLKVSAAGSGVDVRADHRPSRRPVMSSSTTPELLYQRVLPQYRRWRRRVWAVQTTDEPQYCRRGDQPHGFWAMCNVMRKIDHRVMPTGPGRHHGFVDAVFRDLKQDIQGMKREAATIADLQAAVDDWLWKYNHSVIAGFPGWGRSPAEVVREGSRG